MSEPLTSESTIVRDHLGFIDLLGQRLREDAYGLDGTPIGPISAELPGLEPLFDSLVSASQTPKKVKERLVEDWNPMAQRILLSDEAPPAASAFERDFSLVATYAQTFVEWGHEAIHILAMEPWLCGRREIGTEQEFVAWNLASEGLAFWYADIVITRTIRRMIPEAEFVYSRQSVSNTSFHPEQAFRRLGLHDADQILPLYIAAFLGAETPLASQGHPFSTVLSQRLRDFYTGTSATLESLHAVLETFRVFDDFYPRFCAVPGLPSLFDEEVLDATWAIDDYHVRLGTELLPGLRELPAARIQRVCARRHVQTRAYYGWFLQRALEERWVFGNAELRTHDVLASVRAYVDGLEQILRTAVVAGDPSEVRRQLAQLDAFYTVEVKQPLERGEAHVKYRYRLYPYFAPTGGIMGLADQRSNLAADEMLEVVRFVMARCAWDESLIARLHHFTRVLETDAADQLRAAYNDFMTHPLALVTWSVRLDELDPARNQFREFVFEYT